MTRHGLRKAGISVPPLYGEILMMVLIWVLGDEIQQKWEQAVSTASA